MLLAPGRNHNSQRQSAPDPAPQRRAHLSDISSSCNSPPALPQQALHSTPAFDAHTFACHRTKGLIQDWILPFKLKKNHMQIILIPVTMRPLGDQEGSCQMMCNMDSSVTSREWSQAGSQQLLMQLGLSSSYSTQRLASRQWMLATINNYQFRIDSDGDWRLKAFPYLNAKLSKAFRSVHCSAFL